MKALTVSIIVVLGVVSLVMAYPPGGIPDPEDFKDHNNGDGSAVLTITELNANYIDGDVVTLSNWNTEGVNGDDGFDPYGDGEIYEDVDYIIIESITFGDDVEASLEILEGTTVWFALETENDGIWVRVLETYRIIYGDVNGVCTLTFEDGESLTCGGDGDDQITLEPWPCIENYLFHYYIDEVPIEPYEHHPEGSPDGLYVDERNYFAGALIFEGGTHYISNTKICNMIGGDLRRNVSEEFILSWKHGENDANYSSCFAIKLLDGASLYLECVELRKACFMEYLFTVITHH